MDDRAWDEKRNDSADKGSHKNAGKQESGGGMSISIRLSDFAERFHRKWTWEHLISPCDGNFYEMWPIDLLLLRRG